MALRLLKERAEPTFTKIALQADDSKNPERAFAGISQIPAKTGEPALKITQKNTNADSGENLGLLNKPTDD